MCGSGFLHWFIETKTFYEYVQFVHLQGLQLIMFINKVLDYVSKTDGKLFHYGLCYLV